MAKWESLGVAGSVSILRKNDGLVIDDCYKRVFLTNEDLAALYMYLRGLTLEQQASFRSNLLNAMGVSNGQS